MTTLTSNTTFTILEAPADYEESVDLYLYPENSGADAFRELHYPGDLYPPIIYDSNPDKWENFDSAPMTDRPMSKTEQTLTWAQTVQWKGYFPDRPVREIWEGSATRSRMTAYMLRRLYEYFSNPPDSGYIAWIPKDRTEQSYDIILESVTVGGQDIVMFMAGSIRRDVMPLEVVVQFRIVGETA